MEKKKMQSILKEYVINKRKFKACLFDNIKLWKLENIYFEGRNIDEDYLFSTFTFIFDNIKIRIIVKRSCPFASSYTYVLKTKFYSYEVSIGKSSDKYVYMLNKRISSELGEWFLRKVEEVKSKDD